MKYIEDLTRNQPENSTEEWINGYDGDWPEPLPPIAKIDTEPYPIKELPGLIREAIKEVRDFNKAPIPLIASSALTALSLSGQAHIDVERADGLSGATSLFTLMIADSGERKTTCDNYFTQPIRDYEKEQREASKQLTDDYRAEKSIWEAKYAGVKETIRNLSKTGKPTHNQELLLRDLERNKPEPPRIPRCVYVDITPEALAMNLAETWPSSGVISSEAGLVFGSHGMGKDSIMRNLAILNQLWDGTDVSVDRRTKESFTVSGARLTVGLQVQEKTFRDFFDNSNGLARGTGFLSRFLVAWPTSTQGSRLYTDPPKGWPALEAFNHRIKEILQRDTPIDETGALTPTKLTLTENAKKEWIDFHDLIEVELAAGGKFQDVKDVASKVADNAARIAALFQLFEYDDGPIEGDILQSAARVAAWHLTEARRFFGELAFPEEQSNAVGLDKWLIDCCRKTGTNTVPRREVQQKITPHRLRKRKALDSALEELVECGRIRLTREGRGVDIQINPEILD